jgi:hypothetical protein
MKRCYDVCCGLDVHKKTVAACLPSPGPDGQRVALVRTFATTTGAFLETRRVAGDRRLHACDATI